jgi:hypothetical protein
MALEIEALARQDPAAAAHGAWAALDWLEQAEGTLSSGPSLYLALARAFTASGDQEIPHTMIDQARRLADTQAARVQPASLRESFLRNSRVNREIQAMWNELAQDEEGQQK